MNIKNQIRKNGNLERYFNRKIKTRLISKNRYNGIYLYSSFEISINFNVKNYAKIIRLNCMRISYVPERGKIL